MKILFAFGLSLLLFGCAQQPPQAVVLDDTLRTAFARDGLAVYADGCYQYRPLGADTFIKADSEALASTLKQDAAAALHKAGVQERTLTAPFYCGMLVNSIIDKPRYADSREAKGRIASPPYYSYPQMAQYPAAVDAYLRLLRSVYGVVLQDSSANHVPLLVDALTLGVVGMAASASDASQRKSAEAEAAQNGVTETSAAALRSRLKARYVLMVAELRRETTTGSNGAAMATAVLTLGLGCLASTSRNNVCDTEQNIRFTTAALVDLQSQQIVWQSKGKTLDEALKALLS